MIVRITPLSFCFHKNFSKLAVQQSHKDLLKNSQPFTCLRSNFSYTSMQCTHIMVSTGIRFRSVGHDVSLAKTDRVDHGTKVIINVFPL